MFVGKEGAAFLLDRITFDRRFASTGITGRGPGTY